VKTLSNTKNSLELTVTFALTRYLSFSILLLIISFTGLSQCNTTLNKLVPDRSVNNDDRFGSTIASNGQYMVVAAENSDTTGIYYGGAAYVYEKTMAGWAYRAMLTPSDPDEYDFFGNQVAIDASGNTIVVINRNYKNGGAYIFEKPASGWQTLHETANIKFPEYLEFNSALDISEDGSTIVVSNPMSPKGMLYLLQKPASGWTSGMTPETLVTRAYNSSIYYGNDVLVQGDYIYASTSNEGLPAIHVYKKGNTTYSLIANLSASMPAYYFGMYLTIYGNMIAAQGIAYHPASDTYSNAIFIFKKNGEWSDMTEKANFDLPSSTYRYDYPIEFTSATQLTAGVLVQEGDYHTGKILEMTTTDGTWHDVSVVTLFEDTELPVPAEFANEVVWNGSDLLMAATRKAVGNTYRNAVVSLTRSGGLWGSLQQVILPRNSSSNVYFGSSIVKTKDVMFAGAPYDGSAGRGAGAVYIYDTVGTDFVRIHTIYPSPRKIRSGNGSDAGFGYSLAVYGDELAVGAPSFLYSSVNYGKIFLYKRTTSDWRSLALYDSIVPPGNLQLNHVGATIAMNDHVLFASAYNNFNDEHTNAVIVFEKINDKWTYKQLIKLGKPIDKSWPSVKFSLNGDQLAIGQYFTIDGGVSILDRNATTAMWEVTAAISGDVFSGLGGAVKLQDNHLFVGAPGLSYNNVYRSGAVFVFTRLPGESWQSNMQASSVISAMQPVEGGFFGSSLDVVGNTLAVGAPGMFLTFDSNVRTIPGNTYIIQSKDYYWKNTIQYLNLQGERYASNERDHFGSAVTIDENYFYIGARSENTSTGQFSGAVYYIPTPPVIFLEPPACKNAQPFTLQAYPFGGTWAGPGVNAALGTFDPSVAGTGIFTLTYSTPNCNYQGTVQIEVKNPISVQQLSPAEVFICSEATTTLQLESVSGTTYGWYYRQDSGASFVHIAGNGASLTVTNPGEYKAIVSGQCSSESPVFRIALENFSITVGPQPVVCSAQQNVSLVTSKNTGAWEGTGVTGNQFNATGLNNGFYRLTYRITTTAGCHIALIDSIKVNAVPLLTINKADGDFCQTGAATLRAAPVDNAFTYTWYFKQKEIETPVLINQVLSNDATVYSQGYYQVSATNGECSNVSNWQEVGFVTDLAYTLLPGENTEVQVCNADDFTLTINAREGTDYAWKFKSVDADTYQTIAGETSSQLRVSEDGFYVVQGAYGFCSFETSPVSMRFVRDSVFVPNVFTPNGDDKNAVFKVLTTTDISMFQVFDRYGDEICRNAAGEWDGGEASSGVYFWHVILTGCDKLQQELKGWVQLLR
jgi:gliding motility-associated-like protein